MVVSYKDRGTRGLSASLTWAASVGLFAYGGHLLDGRIGTPPLFLVLGALLGGVGGFVHFLATLAPEMLPFGKKHDPARKDAASNPPTDPKR